MNPPAPPAANRSGQVKTSQDGKPKIQISEKTGEAPDRKLATASRSGSKGS